jgi:hypothetical protein
MGVLVTGFFLGITGGVLPLLLLLVLLLPPLLCWSPLVLADVITVLLVDWLSFPVITGLDEVLTDKVYAISV